MSLLGGSDIDYGSQSGGRLGATFWFDSNAMIGLEASGFLLNKETATSSVASDNQGTPLLVRPIFNALTQSESVLPIAAPLVFTGSASLSSTTPAHCRPDP